MYPAVSTQRTGYPTHPVPSYLHTLVALQAFYVPLYAHIPMALARRLRMNAQPKNASSDAPVLATADVVPAGARDRSAAAAASAPAVSADSAKNPGATRADSADATTQSKSKKSGAAQAVAAAKAPKSRAVAGAPSAKATAATPARSLAAGAGDRVDDTDDGDEPAESVMSSGFSSRVQFEAQRRKAAAATKPAAAAATLPGNDEDDDDAVLSAPPTPTGEVVQDESAATPKKPKKKKTAPKKNVDASNKKASAGASGETDARVAEPKSASKKAASKKAAPVEEADAEEEQPEQKAASKKRKRADGGAGPKRAKKSDPLDAQINDYVINEEREAQHNKPYDRTMLMCGRSDQMTGLPATLVSWTPPRVVRMELVLRGSLSEDDKGMKSVATEAHKRLQPLKEYGATGDYGANKKIVQGAIAKARVELNEQISRCSAAGDKIVAFSLMEDGVAQVAGTYGVVSKLAEQTVQDTMAMCQLIREHGSLALDVRWRAALILPTTGVHLNGYFPSDMTYGQYVDNIKDALTAAAGADGLLSQKDYMCVATSLAALDLTPDLFEQPELNEPAAKKRKTT